MGMVLAADRRYQFPQCEVDNVAEKKFDPDEYLAKTQPKTNEPKASQKQFNPDEYLAGKQDEPAGAMQQLGRKALDAVISVGNTVDSYTGAPARAAIGAIQDEKNPLAAYVQQFGKDPSQAPTGKQIAEKAGSSTEENNRIPFTDYKFSNAGAVGLAVDVLADPTNFLPVVGTAKVLAGGTARAAILGARGTALGIDVATGTKAATKVLEYGGEKANQVRKVLDNYFKPQRAGDFEEMFSLAQKHGVDVKKLPEAVEFGKDSVITRLARARAEGPIGEKYLREFTESLDQVDSAMARSVESIGNGIVPSREQAGKLLRDGYDDAVSDLFRGMEVRHSKIVTDYPGLMLPAEELSSIGSKLDGVEKFAKGRMARGVTALQEEQAKRLLKATEAIRNSRGSYKQMYEALSDIGEAAYKPQSTMAAIPADVERMRDIYNTISSALINTVEKNVGADVASELVQNNKAISTFLKQTDAFAKKLGDGSLANETVFDSLIKRGDSRQIDALKNIIAPEKFQQIKAAYIDSIIPRSAEGGVHYRTFSNIMNKEKERLSRLLDPSEAENLTEIATLGTRFGTPILSTSGTGASNRLRNLPTAIADSLVDDAAIEKLKLSARGQLLDISASKIKGFTAPIVDMNRGYVIRKGSQTYSTQQREGN